MDTDSFSIKYGKITSTFAPLFVSILLFGNLGIFAVIRITNCLSLSPFCCLE